MIRVRFAPSPTGRLHLGNIRTALFNYLLAKKSGGVFVLRIEDTDRERSKQEYLDSQIEDLLWMGLRWDEGPEVGGPYGPYLQSQRMDLYRSYADRLIAEGKAYYCYVTEPEVEEMKRLAVLEKRPPHFDNRGRYFTAQEIEERKARGIKPTLRFKIDQPLLKMHDLIRGDVEFHLEDMMGDFVIMRADGMPTFHLAVCVDDALMKVTHVIRGEDHLSNTPKHILLLKAMGFEPPQYGHLSLVHGEGGGPLSKSIGSVSMREFRRQGYLPHALANYIALLGWSPGDNREIFSWQELIESFDLGKVNKAPSSFDSHKLNWLNGEHLRRLGSEDFSRSAMVYLKEQGVMPGDETRVHKVLPVFKDNVEKFMELPDRLKVLEDLFEYESPAMLKTDDAREILTAALETLPLLNESDPHLYDSFLAMIKPRVKAKGKNLFMPLRMALTGKEHGPELKQLFPALGRTSLEKRFRRALAG